MLWVDIGVHRKFPGGVDLEGVNKGGGIKGHPIFNFKGGVNTLNVRTLFIRNN